MHTEPQTERGRRSRARIVDAAADLMAECGVDATTCERVVAAAGASKSQLYHYFDGKEDLVRAVIAARFEQVIAAQQPAIDELDSFAGIRRWFDHLVALNDAAGWTGCLLTTMAAELADRDPDAQALLTGMFERWEGYITAGLTAMRDRGQLRRNVDPVRLGAATFATIQGGLLQSKVRKDPNVLGFALDAAFAHLQTHRK